MTFSLKLVQAIWGLDWMTMCGPEKAFKPALKLLRNLPGPLVFEDCPGQLGYQVGQKIMSDIGQIGVILIGHDSHSSWWLIRLTGKGCEYLGSDRVAQLGADLLALPGDLDEKTGRISTVHCSRLDIACDLRGPGCATFLDNILASYKAGEMKHAQNLDLFPKYAKGKLVGNGIRCGSRSSSQFTRMYDKGLESGTESAGKWIRWESQFNKKMAQIALETVLDGDGGAMSYACFAGAVVEFCETTGRRAHVPWYKEFVRVACSGSVRRLSSARPPRDLIKYVAWLRKAPAPRLFRVAAATGCTPGDVLNIALGTSGLDIPPSPADADPIDRMLCKLVREALECGKPGLDLPD